MVSSFIQLEGRGWGKRMDGGIVILASCEYQFFRVYENLVQHTSNNISICNKNIDLHNNSLSAPYSNSYCPCYVNVINTSNRKKLLYLFIYSCRHYSDVIHIPNNDTQNYPLSRLQWFKRLDTQLNK